MREQKKFWTKVGASLLSFGLVFTMITPTSLFGKESEVTPYAADTTKPVIEKIEFPDNGKTLEPGEQALFYVDVYDTESGIKDIFIEVQYTGQENERGDKLKLNKKEGNRYVAKIDALYGYTGLEISYLTVIDNAGNYESESFYTDEGAQYNFSIHTVLPDYGEVLDVSLDRNQQTVEWNDMLNLKATLSNEVAKQFDFVEANFYNEEAGHTYNLALNQIGTTNQYEVNFHNEGMSEGTYVLQEMFYVIDRERIRISIPYEKNEEIWYTLNHYEPDEKDDTICPEIVSVQIDKNKETLKSGDTVTVRVKAKDNKTLYKEGSVDFRAMAPNVYESTISICVNYEESTGEYVGTYTIKDDTYPCEWLLSKIWIEDESGNSADSYKYTDNNELPYFYVQNDDTIVIPTFDLYLDLYILDDNGNYRSYDTIEKDEIFRRTTLKELGITLPIPETSYNGLKFQGWVDSYGNKFDENTEITYETSLFACYDKKVVDITYNYVSSNLEAKEVNEKVLVEPNVSYKEFLDNYTLSPTDMYSSIPFIKWHITDSFDENDIIPVNSVLNAEAEYSGHHVLIGAFRYFSENGRYESVKKPMFVKNGVSNASVVGKFLENDVPNPKHYEGLRFEKWNIDENNYWDNIYEYAYISAIYENCILNFYIYDSDVDSVNGVMMPELLDQIIFVAEKNKVFTLPDLSKYKNLVWRFAPEGDSFVVKNDMTFIGFADGIIEPDKPTPPEEKPEEPEKPIPPEEKPEKPEKPSEPVDQPEKPTTPEKPSKPSEPNKVVTLPKDTIDKVVESINKAEKKEIVVNMKDATVVPKDILEAAKGKDVEVKLDMGGYTWTINGKDILASDLKDINLEVKMDTNAIPNKVITELAGDHPVKKLSLTHNGDFGFKASLSVNVGSEYVGKFGNLYYYDSDGKMVFMNAGKIDEKGNVELSFSHASDYVIVIDEKKATVTDNDAIKDTARSLETSGGMMMLLVVLMGAGAVLMSKKRC